MFATGTIRFTDIVPIEYLDYYYQGPGCATKETCKVAHKRQVDYVRRIAPQFKSAFQRGLTLPYYGL